MKHILYLFFTSTFFMNCNTMNPPNKINCFLDADTAQIMDYLWCGDIYKKIDNKYIIKIKPKIDFPVDRCFQLLNIDSSNIKCGIELYIYDQNNAKLDEICSDVIINHTTSHKRILSLINGYIDMMKHSTKNSNINCLSILLKKAKFHDQHNSTIIEFKDQLIWKVRDFGIPG